MASTYAVTSKYSFPTKLLGVKIATWNLEYRYQANAKVVLKDYACSAWHSGFAGFWKMSVSTKNYVSGGLGNCIGLFTGGLVFKGSFYTMNKEMGMVVDGRNIQSTWLKNV